MHDRDLSRRAAEADEAEADPVGKRRPERDGPAGSRPAASRSGRGVPADAPGPPRGRARTRARPRRRPRGRSRCCRRRWSRPAPLPARRSSRDDVGEIRVDVLAPHEACVDRVVELSERGALLEVVHDDARAATSSGSSSCLSAPSAPTAARKAPGARSPAKRSGAREGVQVTHASLSRDGRARVGSRLRRGCRSVRADLGGEGAGARRGRRRRGRAFRGAARAASARACTRPCLPQPTTVPTRRVRPGQPLRRDGRRRARPQDGDLDRVHEGERCAVRRRRRGARRPGSWGGRSAAGFRESSR